MGRSTNPQVTNSLLSTTPVDLKTVGQTILYTVPAGRSLIIDQCIFSITLANTVTLGPTVTVGANGTFNDYCTSTVVSTIGLGQTSYLLGLGATTIGSKVFVAGDVIKFNVTVGATATAMTANIYLFGLLI